MKITNEAKAMLEEVFNENDADCLKVSVQESCCGPSVVVNLAELEDGEEPIMINGISVIMAEDAKEKTQKVTISVEDGELSIQDEDAPGCC